MHVAVMTHGVLGISLDYELELNLVGYSLAVLEENAGDKTDCFQLSRPLGIVAYVHRYDVTETLIVHERTKELSLSKRKRKWKHLILLFGEMS